MNLRLYPMDIQVCPLIIESCKYIIRKDTLTGDPGTEADTSSLLYDVCNSN